MDKRFRQLLESKIGNVKPLREDITPSVTPLPNPPDNKETIPAYDDSGLDLKSFEGNLPECVDFLSRGANDELRYKLKPGTIIPIAPLIDGVLISRNAPGPENFIFMSKNGKAFCKTKY